MSIENEELRRNFRWNLRLRKISRITIKSENEDYDLKNKKENIIENTHLTIKKIIFKYFYLYTYSSLCKTI